MNATNRDPAALVSLQAKVRVALLYGTAVGLSVSSDANRWGKTSRYKILSSAEARELSEVLRLAADGADRNRVAESEAATARDGPSDRGGS